MNDRERAELIKELQDLSVGGRSTVEIVRWLDLELKAKLGEQYGAHSLIYFLYRAFDLELANVKRSAGWAGLNWGGRRSDAELELLLGELIPRAANHE